KIVLTYDRYPKRTILVHGYTSADEKNKKNLSLKRAKMVREYLVQVKSVPSNKISLKGFGDRGSVKSNDTARGRALNRRVWVQLIKSGN
ncbi:OmpA family protein, partial [bacterium]|nr:OmpA family protein [bacterium]